MPYACFPYVSPVRFLRLFGLIFLACFSVSANNHNIDIFPLTFPPTCTHTAAAFLLCIYLFALFFGTFFS
ncbi:hypothetical protein R3P38DRAFT_1947230 [Favolaschia claudopus]|uniref:Uncharacterized protein n=1 Tax=Favolaschia claudopus TaxID=2862362 RepID=A0AAW0A038_9AGAR